MDNINKLIDLTLLKAFATDADIQKIFTAIDKELKNTKLKFSVSEVEDDKFRL